MPTDPRLQVILRQIQTVLVILERPIVQRQLVALVVATLLAWALAEGLQLFVRRVVLRWSHRRVNETTQTHLRRWLAAANQLAFPLFGLALVRLLVLHFTRAGQPAGLLRESVLLFWVLLAYRLIVALLYVTLPEPLSRQYHRRLLMPLFAGLVLARLIESFIDVNLLAQIELVSLFDTVITLGTLVAAVIVFYLFLLIAWIAQDSLNRVIMPRTAADPGVTHSVLTITRYFIITLGILVVAGTLGFDLTTLALIGGGLSIGIGFGLQQIVANFISGILLLFEQTLRPGDVIEIDGRIGTVEKLNIRSTLVRTNDDIEIIVPNETFLTSQVTTYTRSSRLVRLSLTLGVSYDSDPKQIRTILLETAAKHGLVLSEPAPAVFFNGFGDSSLDFRLAVWIDQPRRIPRVRSDLYFMIWEAFARHHVEIPFPQHDLNLGRGWEKFITSPESREADHDDERSA